MAFLLATNAIELTPAYKPIIFQINSTVAGAVQVSADIFINGTLFSTVYSDKIVQNLGGSLYGFFIDVSAPIKDYLTYKLLGSGLIGDTIDTSAQARININFYEWRVISGLLTRDVVTTVSSNTFIAINATRKAAQYPQMWLYLQSVSGVSLPLTNRPFYPFTLKANLGESEYVGCYCDTATDYIVITYNAAGSAIGIGTRSLQAFTTSGGIRTNALRLIASGAANINAMSGSGWVTYPAYPEPYIDENVAYWVVAWGYVAAVVFGIPIFVSYGGLRYTLGKDCEDSVRVKWLNPFGVFDYYTFPKYNEVPVESKPEIYERQRPYTTSGSAIIPPAVTDRGQSALLVESDVGFELESFAMTEEESYWLRELGESPEVYIEAVFTDTGNKTFFPVVLDKSKNNIAEDEDTGYVTLTFKGTFAETYRSQAT